VSSFNNDRVLRYNETTGAFINTFASGGGLDGPRSLVFGADGNLYVSSYSTNNAKRYNGTTWVFIDDFVSAGSGGLSGPIGLTFTPRPQQVIPEPSTLILLAVGMVRLVVARRWRRGG
jgi:hypothetical protein